MRRSHKSHVLYVRRELLDDHVAAWQGPRMGQNASLRVCQPWKDLE